MRKQINEKSDSTRLKINTAAALAGYVAVGSAGSSDVTYGVTQTIKPSHMGTNRSPAIAYGGGPTKKNRMKPAIGNQPIKACLTQRHRNDS